jgi:hypothetical protein
LFSELRFTKIIYSECAIGKDYFLANALSASYTNADGFNSQFL